MTAPRIGWLPGRDLAGARSAAEGRGMAAPRIGWLLGSTAEVPAHDAWLGPRERSRLAALHVAKRRIDWRLGRWCAKRAVRAFAGLTDPLAALEILADPDGGPRAWLGDQPLPLVISITHRDGRAACAVSGGLRLGCDLETVEPRSEAFLRDFFTAREARRALRLSPRRRPLYAALVWSAKESALKALRTGLRRDTRSVEVTRLDEEGAADPAGWHPLAVRDAERGERFHGWWRALDGQVLTVVTDGRGAGGAPVRLDGDPGQSVACSVRR